MGIEITEKAKPVGPKKDRFERLFSKILEREGEDGMDSIFTLILEIFLDILKKINPELSPRAAFERSLKQLIESVTECVESRKDIEPVVKHWVAINHYDKIVKVGYKINQKMQLNLSKQEVINMAGIGHLMVII